MAAQLNAGLPGRHQWHTAVSDMGCMADKSKHMISV